MNDVVIVGGGIIGASTAYFLSNVGIKVKVIEYFNTFSRIGTIHLGWLGIAGVLEKKFWSGKNCIGRIKFFQIITFPIKGHNIYH